MSLINKYRPKKFKEVKGQDEIVKSLIQSINKNKLHNAYLFAGKYGTGKTTLARLLARGINCLNFKNDLCGQCESCKNPGELSIIELDGASYRGIENIRSVTKDSSLIPFNSKYKVYIIDEAHQLTSQASNAFLKTLEEPSNRTKFIFCTTEPWKLLKTVTSRCLPFYLKPIRFRDIKDRLGDILEREKVKIKDERLLYKIAENSNNTLRDAINTLEICLQNTSTNELKLETIEKSLCWVSEKDIYKLIDYLISKKSDKFFTDLNSLTSMGKRYEDIISSIKIQVKEMLFVKKGYVKSINKYKLEKIKKLDYSNKDLMIIFKMMLQLESKILDFVNPRDMADYFFLKILEK